MDEVAQDRQADQRLAERLLRGGVGLRHVRRTLRELRDHRRDLVERMVAEGAEPVVAARDARALLGDQDVLAERMIARPELRSRARRFAWLLFVLGPLPMIMLLGALSILAGAVLFEGADRLWDPPVSGAVEVALTRMLFVWVVPGAVGLLLCRLAVRRGVPAIWPACASAIVALTSGFTHVTGTVRVTGIHFGPGPASGLSRALVFFVVLGVVYLLLRRAQLRGMANA
jgi:hypothetical protein